MFLPREELEAIRNSAWKAIVDGVIDEDEIKNMDGDHLRAHSETVSLFAKIYIANNKPYEMQLKDVVIENAANYINKVVELQPDCYIISVVKNGDYTGTNEDLRLYMLHVCVSVWDSVSSCNKKNVLVKLHSLLKKKSILAIISGLKNLPSEK